MILSVYDTFIRKLPAELIEVFSDTCFPSSIEMLHRRVEMTMDILFSRKLKQPPTNTVYLRLQRKTLTNDAAAMLQPTHFLAFTSHRRLSRLAADWPNSF